MDIGIPKEVGYGERRVGLSPGGVEALVADGHRLWIESKAGLGSGFSDMDFAAAGADLTHSTEETLRRARLVISVGPPREEHLPHLTSDHIWAGFLHLAVAPISILDEILTRGITALDYGTMSTDDGLLPVQKTLSDLTGRLAVHVAANLLHTEQGGPGILLSGLPGVPAADVVVVGAGAVGTSAALLLSAIGAQVTVLDCDLAALERLEARVQRRVVTLASNPGNLRKAVAFADVLVACVLVPGDRAPRLITRDMVRSMRPRSVILDVSIDQGGAVETSRPTSLLDPTFMEEGVLHYCVPNVASAVSRTATHAVTNALLPFLRRIAKEDVGGAVRSDPVVARGVNAFRGRLTHPRVAGVFRRPYERVERLLD
jgi:alanine dehydrogenase